MNTEEISEAQKALHTEEARLERLWHQTENPEKKRLIKAKHAAVVDKLIAFLEPRKRESRPSHQPTSREYIKSLERRRAEPVAPRTPGRVGRPKIKNFGTCKDCGERPATVKEKCHKCYQRSRHRANKFKEGL